MATTPTKNTLTPPPPSYRQATSPESSASSEIPTIPLNRPPPPKYEERDTSNVPLYRHSNSGQASPVRFGTAGGFQYRYVGPGGLYTGSLTNSQHSTQIDCPFCQRRAFTRVESELSPTAWTVSAVLCVCGCWCGCCLIPFCVRDFMDFYHVCPLCNQVVDVYRPIH